VVMSRGLNDRELTGAPCGGVSNHGEVMQEQFRMAALTADPGPKREFSAAPDRNAPRPDRPRLYLRRPDKVG
jgi:hypothetical protein